MPIAHETTETWIFDLDNTLYPASCNLFGQVDLRMGQFIQTLLNLDPVAAKTVQKGYWRTHGTTLRGLMSEHGVDPVLFMDYVHDIDLTVVPHSPALDAALALLPGRKVIFTNGSVEYARRVLAARGIARHFEVIFDIAASDYRPKPDPEPYRWLCERHGIEPKRAVMVEDIVRNLLPAHAMGMGTVWVPAPDGNRDGIATDHVHHVAEDLEAWLIEIAGPEAKLTAG